MVLVKFKGACGNDVMIDADSIEIVYGIKFLDKDCTYVRLIYNTRAMWMSKRGLSER